MIFYFSKFKSKKILFSLFFIALSNIVFSQIKTDSLPSSAKLSDCLHYALQNHPVLKQSWLDEAISKENTRIALSDWLPQVGLNANLIHNNYIIPGSYTPSEAEVIETTLGLPYNSTVSLNANEVIYNNDVFLANRSSKFNRKQTTQLTESEKTDIVVNVSKAFYEVMITEQQLKINKQIIERLKLNTKDTYNQYENGVSDKIDFKRANIELNNALVDKKKSEEEIKAKYETLKHIMGCSTEKKIKIQYDSTTMANDIMIDTLEGLPYENRIEYKILQTQLQLEKFKVDYFKMSYIPSLSAFANYNIIYQNPDFSELYAKNFPYSLMGLTLTLPIFTGTKRIHSLHKAKYQYEQLALDSVILKSTFYVQYTQALTSYKSNLMEFKMMQDNVQMAKEVYNMVKDQYESGIKTYLEVIQAETDLQTSELNQLQALSRVLSGKIDIQRALGTVSLNY